MLLVALSFVLIVRDNAYQRSVYLSSANEVSGRLYEVSSSLTSYFGLHAANEDLMERVSELEARIQYLEANVRETYDSATSVAILRNTENFSGYTFIPAQVSNNSVAKVNNYITINKGKLNGIKPDMGVISPTGAVGVVSIVSNHFAVVIPLLNPKSSLSCKIKRTNHFGPLQWEPGDPRYAILEKVPRHIPFNKGDTVVTSGFSSIFPEGIMVGIVAGSKKEKDDNLSSLKIELSTDFHSLKDVLVIANQNKDEQQDLERRVSK